LFSAIIFSWLFYLQYIIPFAPHFQIGLSVPHNHIFLIIMVIQHFGILVRQFSHLYMIYFDRNLMNIVNMYVYLCIMFVYFSPILLYGHLASWKMYKTKIAAVSLVFGLDWSLNVGNRMLYSDPEMYINTPFHLPLLSSGSDFWKEVLV